jgi:hypothetical protein
VSLESLAAKIMTQLARRNVLIVDVEIWEYAKKKVSYRETSSGIVIKNKKFSFDAKGVVETDDFEDCSAVPAEKPAEFKPLPSPSKDLADRSCPIAAKNLARRPIRHEVYDPEPLAEFKASQKGLKFTKGKKYPVYSESSMGTTVVYKTTDDAGRDVDISSEYFVAIGRPDAAGRRPDVRRRGEPEGGGQPLGKVRTDRNARHKEEVDGHQEAAGEKEEGPRGQGTGSFRGASPQDSRGRSRGAQIRFARAEVQGEDQADSERP